MVRREACDAAPPASVELCSGEHGLYHNAQDNAMWQKMTLPWLSNIKALLSLSANGATIRKSHCVMSCFSCSAVDAFAIGCRYRIYVDETDMLSLTAI